MESLQRTPLYDTHKELGARLVPFAGWEMPVQYSSILEEHRTVREAAGLFDVSHMGEVWVTGKEACAFLDFLVTNAVEPLPPGKALYTVMCYPDGGVVDDLIIYRLGDERFFLVINAGNIAKDIAWIKEKGADFDCTIDHASDRYAQLALQGPQSSEIVAALGATDITAMSRFTVLETTLADIPVIAARTGYTGEDGFEFYIAPEQAVSLATTLLQQGTPFGLKPIGLGARDSLRLEAGYPLYGHELSDSISPLQAGLGWVVKLQKKSDFIGKSALTAEKKNGIPRKLVWFILEGRRIAREGTPVLSNGVPVGTIQSGTLSPLLNAPIGSALVQTEADPETLYVDLRGHQIPLKTAKPPLHRSA